MIYIFGNHSFNVQKMTHEHSRFGRFVDPNFPKGLRHPFVFCFGRFTVLYRNQKEHRRLLKELGYEDKESRP